MFTLSVFGLNVTDDGDSSSQSQMTPEELGLMKEIFLGSVECNYHSSGISRVPRPTHSPLTASVIKISLKDLILDV